MWSFETAELAQLLHQERLKEAEANRRFRQARPRPRSQGRGLLRTALALMAAPLGVRRVSRALRRRREGAQMWGSWSPAE